MRETYADLAHVSLTQARVSIVSARGFFFFHLLGVNYHASPAVIRCHSRRCCGGRVRRQENRHCLMKIGPIAVAAVIASLVGTLLAQYLINNVASVRRTIGGF